MWKLAFIGIVIAIGIIIFMPLSANAYDSSNVTSIDLAFENDVTIDGLTELENSISGISNSLNLFTDAATGLFYIIPLLAISILAFWKENAFLFMIAFGLAWLTGLNAPDILNGNSETTTLGITLGLMVIGYGMFCAVMAFRLMFWEGKE